LATVESILAKPIGSGRWKLPSSSVSRLKTVVGIAGKNLRRGDVALQIGAGKPQIIGVLDHIVNGSRILDDQMQRRILRPERRAVERRDIHLPGIVRKQPDHVRNGHTRHIHASIHRNIPALA
jgi:hypothetical protein